MPEQRNTNIDYPPFAKFTPQSCTIAEIKIPQISRSVMAPVYNTNAPSALNYHTTDKKEFISDIKIVFVPHDNAEGKALLPHAKELVEAVLKKNYKTSDLTVIRSRYGKEESKTFIADCVIKEVLIQADDQEYIRIVFTLIGILNSPY